MACSKSRHYRQVSQFAEKESEPLAEFPENKTSGRRWKTVTVLVILVTLTSLACLIHRNWHPAVKREMTIVSCGTSAAEARALGCTFDIMMDSWLPANCYDKELSEEFRSIKDWPFYADKNRTRRLSNEELSEMTVHAHTTIEYHYNHCIFSWRKFHRAVESGRHIEEEVARHGHTNHCANVLKGLGERLDNPQDLMSLKNIGTKLNVAFPKCIRVAEVMEGGNSKS